MDDFDDDIRKKNPSFFFQRRKRFERNINIADCKCQRYRKLTSRDRDASPPQIMRGSEWSTHDERGISITSPT
jgi:hypothetical protein